MSLTDTKRYIALVLLFMLAMSGLAVSAKAAAEELKSQQALSLEKQTLDFQHILYQYFQQDYAQTLTFISTAEQHHGFNHLPSEDKDRVALMRAASQFQLGLRAPAQRGFQTILQRTTSDYVQAQTWYWLAKSSYREGRTEVADKAFSSVSTDALKEQLSDEQWQELYYLYLHQRVSESTFDTTLISRLPASSIYPAYLWANYATALFNNQQYPQAIEAFVTSKQALLKYNDARSGFFSVALEYTDTVFSWINPLRWFSFDENALAQEVLSQEQERQIQREQDALFDRINVSLGSALIANQSFEDAQAVLSLVADQQAESEQALLSMGWALIEMEQWQAGIDVWQALLQSPDILQRLQAGYGIAYAHHQRDDVVKTYYALDESDKAIQQGLEQLQLFKQQVQQPDFFSTALISASKNNNDIDASDDSASVSTDNAPTWPTQLRSLQRDFMTQLADSTEANTGASQYSGERIQTLLNARQEASSVLESLAQQQQRVRQLMQFIEERRLSVLQRLSQIDLAQEQSRIDSGKAQIAKWKSLLNDARVASEQGLQESSDQDLSQQANAKQQLMIEMLSAREREQWMRIERAEKRIARLELLTDEERKQNRVRPLKPAQIEKLKRLKGILTWKMESHFVQNAWRAQRTIEHAQAALLNAERSLQNVIALQQSPQDYGDEQQRLLTALENISQAEKQAQSVYQNADSALRTQLIALIETRESQLQTQWVNTRLAKIRLQDMPDISAKPLSNPELDSSADPNTQVMP